MLSRIALSSKARFFLSLVGVLLLFCLWFGLSSPTKANTCPENEAAYEGLQIPKLTGELEGTGLIGSIHGAVPGSRMFVLSVREPDNFFKHQEFSLIAGNEETFSVLKNLRRHDRLCVRGEFIENISPQKHILARSVQVQEKWSGGENFPADTRSGEIPDELTRRSNLIGKVHAIAATGQILVIEYGDTIYPIYVEKGTEKTRDLYRGDIIQIAYKIQSIPSRPTHLQLNLDSEKPIEILDPIAAWNGQPKTLTGQLVKFPQSPQIAFDVYAIAVETRGVNRYFTLVNFENDAEFRKIREKLSRIWERNSKTAIAGRNFFLNPRVAIEARGIINVISPQQANPQILLPNADAIREKT